MKVICLISLVLAFQIREYTSAQDYKSINNMLVDDIEYAASYGYKCINYQATINKKAVVFDFNNGDRIISVSDYSYCIDGPGFFKLHDTSGRVFYTRNGDFELENDVLTYSGRYIVDTDLVSCSEKKGNSFVAELVIPAEKASVKRIGPLFSFSETTTIRGVVYSHVLELSNSEPLTILRNLRSLQKIVPIEYSALVDREKIIDALFEGIIHEIFDSEERLYIFSNAESTKIAIASQGSNIIDRLRYEYMNSWCTGGKMIFQMLRL